MNRIISWLAKPFRNNLSYFILLFLLISAIDVYYFGNRGLIPYTIYILFFNLTTCYFLCMIGELIPSKSASIYRRTILTFAIICCIVDTFSLLIYQQPFNQEFATIIMQTNPAEIGEFFETFISIKYFLIIAIIFLLVWKGYRTLHSINAGKKVSIILLTSVIIGTALSIRNPLVYIDTFAGKIVSTLQTPQIPDLKEFLTHPEIIHTKARQPKHVVLLIGESFSKSHSSMYGYAKTTNPYLTTLKDSSYLHLYQEVQTPALHTLAAIQCILSTYKPEYKDSIPWYQCTSIPEVIRLSGYQTHWVSNQSKIGVFDTGTGRYADLCDDQYFVGDKFAGMRRTYCDELVIPLIKPLLQDTTNHHFYFMQLMGSHSTFKKRYPETFNRFKPEDYVAFPEHQRENLATYDNSILYNDSVVYEIMKLYHDKEAIVFYFSDHAIDVYESTDNYIGHARSTDPKSAEAGSKIPFMIYTSPLYQQNFPEEMEQIRRCINQPFRTDDMIYTIMDIIGVEFKGESLEGRSLFRL